jgi:aspartate/methionine/tyrosine aminotransferase
MLAPIAYLGYAAAHFGRRRYDFASSGMPAIAPREIEIALDATADLFAAERFAAAIAARYGVRVEEVVPCLGTSQALWAACAALVAPGSTVAVEEPGYEPLRAVPAGLGARITRFRREPGEGYAIVPERVARAAGPGGVAIVTDLYNPGGVRADPAALVETAHALQGGVLIVDEVYRELRAPVDGPVSARRLAPNIVTISSLTKVYGLGWARAGWLLAPEAIARRVRDAIVHATGTNPPHASLVGAASLARADELAARSRALRGDKLARAASWVSMHACTTWTPPDAEGLFGFVRTEPAADVGALLEGPLAARDVLVADGAFFDAPGWFRLGVTLDGALLDEGLRRLGEALEPAAGGRR